MPEQEQFQLTDLVPLETLEELRRTFKAVAGVPMVFTDARGMAVTGVEDPLLFCGSLVSVEGQQTVCLRRKKWDVPEPAEEAKIRSRHGGTRPVSHRCLGGFRDTAVPIVVQGTVVGYSLFARSLVEEPDIDGFRQMAVDANMEADVGERVARSALVMPAERIKQISEFLQTITGLVASAAYEQLMARRVLELEALRDSLLHMIVHDLRTPLTSILGGLQTVVDTEYDDELTREFVPIAFNSAGMLLEMVNTLLDINKMESGEMTLDLGPVAVAETAQLALDQVAGLAAERGHELVLETCHDDCPVVVGDGDKLLRVMVNLLGNAVKFTQDGGRITLGTRCEGDELILYVADNGPGIPEEYRTKIFEKFGQVETRNAGKKHSTGLGLTFCKMVAEAHGGRVWVDSEVGKGSTFSVAIPLRPAGD